MIHAILVALSLFYATISNSSVVESYDVSKSWEGAQVYVPGNILVKKINSVTVDKPMPVVVFMHGCGGIKEQEYKWAKYIKSLGFIVVLPDSYAIPNRVQNCSSKEKVTNLGLVPVRKLRPAEAEYSINKVKEQWWADKNNIFLMGHSEGGMAAAHTKELGINGVIITGFICHRGVSADSSTPVLAVAWEQDPWFKPKKYFQCQDKWGDRPNGTQVVIPGNGHGTADSVQAKQEVQAFLEKFKK